MKAPHDRSHRYDLTFRLEDEGALSLRDRGITVLGAYPGGIDTDMLAGVEADKAAPELVAERIIAALSAEETVVFPDDASAGAGAVYRQDPLKLEQMLLAS